MLFFNLIEYEYIYTELINGSLFKSNKIGKLKTDKNIINFDSKIYKSIIG